MKKQIAYICAGLVLLAVLISIEMFVIQEGMRSWSALPTDAVVVLGAGVNGTTPSMALRTRLDAALDYL